MLALYYVEFEDAGRMLSETMTLRPDRIAPFGHHDQ